jgi:hypothetical protein
MSLPTFKRFLALATQYRPLLVDLAAEEDLISRARLYSYLERSSVAPADKAVLIENLCIAAILQEEEDETYSVNPVVADLINYYERRGRLTDAGFLRDQMLTITRLTDDLQQQLLAEEVLPQEVGDTIDSLYRLLREVRASGDSHYQACMRLFGDLKRHIDTMSIDARLEQLETIQRRHIRPLEEIVDPEGEYAQRIHQLKRRMEELPVYHQALLAQSQELDSRRRRLLVDLAYIDHNLLRHFITAADTARDLIKSLLEEKQIKTAVATCLGNLDSVWSYLKEAQPTGLTVVARGRRSFPLTDRASLESFFADIIHRRLLPNPVPLHAPLVERHVAADLLITPIRIWNSVETVGFIASWPRHVLSAFAEYNSREQLKAIAYPLTMNHPRVDLVHHPDQFTYCFDTFSLEMADFALVWTNDAGQDHHGRHSS